MIGGQKSVFHWVIEVDRKKFVLHQFTVFELTTVVSSGFLFYNLLTNNPPRPQYLCINHLHPFTYLVATYVEDLLCTWQQPSILPTHVEDLLCTWSSPTTLPTYIEDLLCTWQPPSILPTHVWRTYPVLASHLSTYLEDMRMHLVTTQYPSYLHRGPTLYLIATQCLTNHMQRTYCVLGSHLSTYLED